MSNSGKIIGALLLGAAAGAVLGLLFAPEKGSELRSKIRKNLDDLADDLAQKADDGNTILSDLKEKARATAHTINDVAKEELDNLKSKTTSTPSDHAS